MDEIKTKRRPSWGIYLLLSLLVASVVTIVFGNMSVQQINDELYMTELVERQQYIPFYKWFNGSIEVENPRLDEPITELNNHTLRDVFEGGNAILNPTFSNGTTNWISNVGTLSSDNQSITVINNSGTATTVTLDQNNRFTLNDIVYIKTSMVLTNLTSDQSIISRPYAFVIQKSPVLNTVYVSSLKSTVTNINFRLQYTNIPNNGVYKVYYVYAINLTSLGITSLTVEQMDYYFNQYQYYKNYTDIPIYDVSAYGVTPEQLNVYYNQYLGYLDTMNLQDVYLVYTNPEYNTEIGTTFVVQYQNVTKSVLDTIDNLKGVYEGFKNTLDKIGDFFS